MLLLGRVQRLRVGRFSPHGAYLTDGRDEVLLPRKEVAPEDEVGAFVDVCVLLDSEDRPVATKRRPLVPEGEFGMLRVVAVTDAGVFLDNGWDKDLLLPHRERRGEPPVGESVLVRVAVDEKSGRLIASMRLRRYLVAAPADVRENQEVGLVVAGTLPGGYRVIVDGKWEGGLFEDAPREMGERLTGFVRGVKESRLRVASRPAGTAAYDRFGPELMRRLKREGGFLPFHDGTPAETIRAEFGVSKSVFKATLGTLLRAGSVKTDRYGIRIVEPGSS